MPGVGGNAISGPSLVPVLRLPPLVAIGTALMIDVFSTSDGVVSDARRRAIDETHAAWLAAAAVPLQAGTTMWLRVS